MPIFSHAAIRVGVAFESSLGLPICQPEIAHASQIAVDSLHGFPVCWTWVCSESGNCGNRERDVRASGEGHPVEGAYGFTVWLIVHDCVLCCGRGGLV